MVTLICRGANVELHPDENFNKVFRRWHEARVLFEEMKLLGPAAEKGTYPAEILNKLRFKTMPDVLVEVDEDGEETGEIELDGDGGRFAVWIEDLFGVSSDLPKDQESGFTSETAKEANSIKANDATQDDETVSENDADDDEGEEEVDAELVEDDEDYDDEDEEDDE